MRGKEKIKNVIPLLFIRRDPAAISDRYVEMRNYRTLCRPWKSPWRNADECKRLLQYSYEKKEEKILQPRNYAYFDTSCAIIAWKISLREKKKKDGKKFYDRTKNKYHHTKYFDIMQLFG